MNLAVVNEAVTERNGVEHQFTEEEKNFVVQFAFRSGSKEDTISLIEALAHSADKAESDEIMVTYRSKYDMKPAWVEQVENLLVALEMYRIEEEKAINHLADILTASVVNESGESMQASFPADSLYYEQDGMVVTLGNWLNGRLSCEQIEQLWCELIIPKQNKEQKESEE